MSRPYAAPATRLRSPRAIEYAARIRRLALHEALGLLPYTTGLTAVLSVGLVAEKLRREPTFPYFATVVGWAVLAVAAALVLGTLVCRRLTRSAADLGVSAIASWVVALHVGIVLLAIPVLLLTMRLSVDNILDWRFPVLSKRWLIALYNLAIATFVLFPVAVERWRGGPVADPNAGPGSAERPTVRRHWIAATIGIAVVVAMSWYFAGPPWNLDRHHRVIDWHEQLHLGPLQAISKGYLPYIGPASIVYGPGSQILTYEVMRHSRRFDLVSFRVACAAFEFVALLVVGTAAYWWLGIVPAMAVMLLALAYSPLAFYYTISDGTFAGFYGWANPLRYLAPLIVVPSLARLAYESPHAPHGRLQSLSAVLLGIGWGIGAWIAQENLSTPAVAGGLLLTLLWLTRSVSLRRLSSIVFELAIGFACVALPVLQYYAWRGAASEFVRNYFLNPRAVAMGYSNMWWPAQDAALPERTSYYFTLPFLLVLSTCTLWRLRPLRLESPLDFRRARFLAFMCVQLVCYQTALFRSDNSHLRNTMIALPFILVLGLVDLPQWLATPRWRRMTIRVAFIALTLAVYPVLRLNAWESMVTTPITRFTTNATARSPSDDDGVAFTRVAPLLRDEPMVAPASGLSVRDFLGFASELHDIVGERKTYIASIGNVYTGLLYFMADLTPAPYPLDLETMTFNAGLRAIVIDHMRTHPQDYECFIGTSLAQTEAQMFLDTHPGARTLERHMGPATLYILLAQPSQSVHPVFDQPAARLITVDELRAGRD